MSRSGFWAALNAVAILGLLLVAGCGSRPSAHDYAVYEATLRSNGKLRTDTAPAGIPYSAADLVRNFQRIALRHETDATEPGSEDNWSPNPLVRWHGPLNYGLFGNDVTPVDLLEVRQLMSRIALLTGLEITETEDDVNFLILITTPDEREDFSAHLAKLSPALSDTFDFWRHSPEVICVANNLFSGENGNLIAAGLAVIGSETSGVLRQACLHEEIVQALGLANDHPDVHPSIFNDDGEFALLTEHDEHLLRILYDPRLEPGMTADQAMPVVRRIVAGIPLNRSSANLAEGTAAMVPVANNGDFQPPTPPDASKN